MVAKIAGPDQGGEPVTINEEFTSHQQVPIGRRAAIRVDSEAPTRHLDLRTSNAMVITWRKERGGEVVGGGGEASLEGGDTTGMGLGGVGEDVSTVQHPS